MVGDDPVRHRMLSVGSDPRGLGRGQDQRAKQVDVVIVVLALQYRGDAFEPHAGVDRGARQVDPRAARNLLVLHEDEVPDLDKTVTVLIGAAGRAAGDPLAVIVEDLRARTARSGVAHRPEIIRGGDPDDPRLRQPGDPGPQPRRVVILGIDGDQEPVGLQSELAHHQVPGQLDRPLLEIVAEREVAEHLEKCVMPGGIADVFEVVVLAAGAHAFL